MSVDSLVEQFNAEALALAAQPCAKPLIGITANYSEGQLQLAPGYFRSVEAAGGIPVIIAPKRMPDVNVSLLLDRIDGLLLSGGADINPILVGEDPVPALSGINSERDLFELTLTRLAYNRQIPMLGICRGIQVLAVALGGTVMQDIATSLPQASLIKHSQKADRATATHFVQAVEGSRIEQLLGKRFAVNSFHHQAVDSCGPRFRITAQSADGVIEAIESTEMKSIIGVQWHPECFITEGDTCMMPLFKQLVDDARQFATARRIHHSVLTLDSHCDTPMFFEQEVNLERRDSKILVDFPKMREGHLDVSTMVAYLPQGDCNTEASAAATAQALRTLNEIEERVAHAPGVALACTPAQLYAHKLEGKLSIMRGIENGYAIGKDLQNIEKFARMGVVYITLCHNGDNDICDSARRSTQRHGGLSDFGRDVVREMNRCGMMVDLSHAAETSFYDALQCSATPIVCSHASSRAMCNHPRNLTDDQLRALAQVGGVAQVTLYHGFLRLEEEDIPATIHDGVRHLMHMIDVAGIDHVGIGTDFDGDGGVPGCACASELINFTRLLVAEGLTSHDLQKIWGGNWLRVMQQCQDFSELSW